MNSKILAWMAKYGAQLTIEDDPGHSDWTKIQMHVKFRRQTRQLTKVFRKRKIEAAKFDLLLDAVERIVEQHQEYMDSIEKEENSAADRKAKEHGCEEEENR